MSASSLLFIHALKVNFSQVNWRKACTLNNVSNVSPQVRINNLWALDANLAKGSWQTPWAAYGLVNITVSKPGVRVTMPVVVLIGDEAFAAEHPMSYTATKNQSGVAK